MVIFQTDSRGASQTRTTPRGESSVIHKDMTWWALHQVCTVQYVHNRCGIHVVLCKSLWRNLFITKNGSALFPRYCIMKLCSKLAVSVKTLLTWCYNSFRLWGQLQQVNTFLTSSHIKHECVTEVKVSYICSPQTWPTICQSLRALALITVKLQML